MDGSCDISPLCNDIRNKYQYKTNDDQHPIANPHTVVLTGSCSPPWSSHSYGNEGNTQAPD